MPTVVVATVGLPAAIRRMLGSQYGKGANGEKYPSLIDERVSLANQRVQLDLWPGNGGSITRLEVDGFEILRRAPDGEFDVVESASFPLVPIVNRIPDGRFEFGGKRVQLSGNFMGLPDFIHGHGWRSAWTVSTHEAELAVLDFCYTGHEWPWLYSARQEFRLLTNGIATSLSVTNHSVSLMPACLGFHPYFPTTANTRLYAQYNGHWVNNSRGIVLRRVPGSYRKDFTRGADLRDHVMTDQTHFGFSGHAVLREEGRPTIRISASQNCANLHVFFPPDGSYVAVEPTLGRGDPFGCEPVEYKQLTPGESVHIWMEILAH